MSVKWIRLYIKVKRKIHDNLSHKAHSPPSPYPHSLFVILPQNVTPSISQTPHLYIGPHAL